MLKQKHISVPFKIRAVCFLLPLVPASTFSFDWFELVELINTAMQQLAVSTRPWLDSAE